jgi:hypothetical protein
VDIARLGGDEFLATHESPEVLKTILDDANERLKNAKITYRDADGNSVVIPPDKIPGFSYGIGDDLASADKELYANKAARKAAREAAIANVGALDAAGGSRTAGDQAGTGEAGGPAGGGTPAAQPEEVAPQQAPNGVQKPLFQDGAPSEEEMARIANARTLHIGEDIADPFADFPSEAGVKGGVAEPMTEEEAIALGLGPSEPAPEHSGTGREPKIVNAVPPFTPRTPEPPSRGPGHLGPAEPSKSPQPGRSGLLQAAPITTHVPRTKLCTRTERKASNSPTI